MIKIINYMYIYTYIYCTLVTNLASAFWCVSWTSRTNIHINAPDHAVFSAKFICIKNKLKQSIVLAPLKMSSRNRIRCPKCNKNAQKASWQCLSQCILWHATCCVSADYLASWEGYTMWQYRSRKRDGV